MCVNNLPRVALDCGEAGIRTRDLLITSPASQPLSHRATLSNKHASHTKLKLNYANHQRAMFVSDTHWPAERIITALTYFFVVKQRDETNAAVIGQTVIATRLYQSLKYTQYIVHSTTVQHRLSSADSVNRCVISSVCSTDVRLTEIKSPASQCKLLPNS